MFSELEHGGIKDLIDSTHLLHTYQLKQSSTVAHIYISFAPACLSCIFSLSGLNSTLYIAILISTYIYRHCQSKNTTQMRDDELK
jgi:hypothetical protein